MKICPIILAGGSGTRFWPISRKNSPKQVLNLSGKDTLIGEAVTRFKMISDEEDIHILTTSQNMIQIKNVLPKESKAKYIIEPVAKGTAACILMAALKLYALYGDCIMCVSPSDHYITKPDEFKKSIDLAVKCTDIIESIVTIGINPSFPSTGYGYICCDFASKQGEAFAVSEFVEKPHLIKAKEYISKGNYFWNSGIFVFKASVIIDSYKRFLPRIYNKLITWVEFIGTNLEDEFLANIYQSVQNISIDYGIVERSNDVYVIPVDMGWNDIGSWDSLGCLFPIDENGNIVHAGSVNIDTKNCIIYSEKSLIATIGVEDLIIVNCDDALLICPKNQVQRVKEIVEILNQKNLTQYI